VFTFSICYNERGGDNMKKEATDTLTLRIPISMKVQIEIAATKDGRTMNSWVNKVLKEKLNEEVKK
jgi:predicted HicB family RNase H-like nuclease